jgi:isocitrate dehydrogenase kinase/phosphatase
MKFSMRQDSKHKRVGNQGAKQILGAFDTYQTRFNGITQRARARFETRDWNGMQADVAERLDLYTQVVDQAEAEIRHLLAGSVNNRPVWSSIKAAYSGLIATRDDWDLAETFFNSITRRVFATVGVDSQIEFVDTHFAAPPTRPRRPLYRSYSGAATNSTLIETILLDYQFQVAYQDIQRDAQLVASEVESHLQSIGILLSVERTEMISSAFYRGKGAYLMGRLVGSGHCVPFVLALLNTSQGVVVDAVLLKENEVSILFSFARSYFHIQVERPYDLIGFLKSIMPRKRTAELYISIGYHKHGKTELYRDLLHHLTYSDDKFEVAIGEQGMVMVVFTMPTYNVVLKVIKDHFDYPKSTTREAVMAKYHLVFKRDRAGRLIDAQEFEHLKFKLNRFSDELLNQLRSAAQTVTIEDGHVVMKHVYIERRVIPLNVYLHHADEATARAALIDYGNAIKDLAFSNIFPGDMLLKNFGVTRHGRVVFYDYDELCLLTSCNFKRMPQAKTYEEEMSAEPWFPVGENDLFPEEFKHFLGLQGAWRDVFLEHHGDLFEVNFWQQAQTRLRAGEVIHIFPYARDKRLKYRAKETYKKKVLPKSV